VATSIVIHTTQYTIRIYRDMAYNRERYKVQVLQLTIGIENNCIRYKDTWTVLMNHVTKTVDALSPLNDHTN
jgi:hypothetical protein